MKMKPQTNQYYFHVCRITADLLLRSAYKAQMAPSYVLLALHKFYSYF